MQEGIHVEGGGVVGGKFLVLTTFTIHFTLCLIFIRVWLIEDFLFENRQIDKLRKYMINLNMYLYLSYHYIHNT